MSLSTNTCCVWDTRTLYTRITSETAKKQKKKKLCRSKYISSNMRNDMLFIQRFVWLMLAVAPNRLVPVDIRPPFSWTFSCETFPFIVGLFSSLINAYRRASSEYINFQELDHCYYYKFARFALLITRHKYTLTHHAWAEAPFSLSPLLSSKSLYGPLLSPKRTFLRWPCHYFSYLNGSDSPKRKMNWWTFFPFYMKTI